MTIDVQGTWDEKFAPVVEAFGRNIDAGLDLGASYCHTVEGETVVDIWGGWLDREKTEPWRRDTLINVFSTTKTMAALTCLLLADRGELDLHEPVVNFWPEFGANGKEDIATRHFLSHSAGLAGLDDMVTEETLYDQDAMAGLLAKQKPWWEDRSKSGYHAFTQGNLLGEVVRRKTGKSLGTVFRDEIAGPLGADFFIGVPPERDAQVTTLWPAEDPAHHMLMGIAPYDTLAGRVGRSPAIDSNWSRTIPWRRAEIPAGGGHGNARSVAEIHKILANGGVADGKRFMSEAGCKTIFEVQTHGTDLVLGTPITFGMGFGLNSELVPMGPDKHICYWGGWGGSSAVINMDRRTTTAFVPNQMIQRELDRPDERVAAIAVAMMSIA